LFIDSGCNGITSYGDLSAYPTDKGCNLEVRNCKVVVPGFGYALGYAGIRGIVSGMIGGVSFVVEGCYVEVSGGVESPSDDDGLWAGESKHNRIEWTDNISINDSRGQTAITSAAEVWTLDNPDCKIRVENNYLESQASLFLGFTEASVTIIDNFINNDSRFGALFYNTSGFLWFGNVLVGSPWWGIYLANAGDGLLLIDEDTLLDLQVTLADVYLNEGSSGNTVFVQEDATLILNDEVLYPGDPDDGQVITVTDVGWPETGNEYLIRGRN
jgi:hypothetical protein